MYIETIFFFTSILVVVVVVVTLFMGQEEASRGAGPLLIGDTYGLINKIDAIIE